MYKINLTLQNIRCQFFKLFFGRQKCQTPEKGWIENKDNRSAISYQNAFALNYD